MERWVRGGGEVRGGEVGEGRGGGERGENQTSLFSISSIISLIFRLPSCKSFCVFCRPIISFCKTYN